MRLFLTFAAVIFLIIAGCQQQPSTYTTGNDNREYSSDSINQQSNSEADEQLISSLERQLPLAFQSGGMAPDSYKQIDSQLIQLESKYPERVKKLRDMLEKIPVGGQEKSNAAVQEVGTGSQDNGPVKRPDHRDYSELPNDLEKSTLPECAGLEFTEYPVDMDEIYEISPLGSINPPGHTFPTEHSYLHLNPTGTSNELYELRAPADVTIVHVRTDKGATRDPEDSTIYFALCKDYYGYYNHIKKISDNLLELMKDKECVYMQETCTRNVMIPVKKGSVVGYVGGHQGNFDFGLIDLTKKNKFANPARYGLRSFHVQCAYDYYKADMKEKFFSLIKRKDANRCGIVAQDAYGTLKGNWFYEDSRADMGVDWNRHLSFVENNIEPEKRIIGIGGVISEAKKIIFVPVKSGTSNRNFEDVTPDGNVYCFTDGSSKVIVKMIDADTINIKHTTGQCSGTEQLPDGFEYNR